MDGECLRTFPFFILTEDIYYDRIKSIRSWKADKNGANRKGDEPD